MNAYSKILDQYDGKRIAPFEEIANALSIRPDALEQVTAIIDSDHEHAHVGGTWILKRLIELGLETPAGLCQDIIRWLEIATDKNSRLHLLQILDRIELPDDYHARLYAVATEYATDRNTLVRAWAYNAIALIGVANPDYKDDALTKLKTAASSDAPSVNARIRNTALYKEIKN